MDTHWSLSTCTNAEAFLQNLLLLRSTYDDPDLNNALHLIELLCHSGSDSDLLESVAEFCRSLCHPLLASLAESVAESLRVPSSSDDVFDQLCDIIALFIWIGHMHHAVKLIDIAIIQPTLSSQYRLFLQCLASYLVARIDGSQPSLEPVQHVAPSLLAAASLLQVLTGGEHPIFESVRFSSDSP